MEAAATPLPREDTTPPVTKMYFGAARKALEFLHWNRRTRHYVRKRGACQIAMRNFFCGRWNGARSMAGSGSSALLQNFFHALDVRRHVNADCVVIRFDGANPEAILEPAKLFELFDRLELTRRKRWKFEQRIATESVKAHMLPMMRSDGCLRIAHPGNRRARKIKTISVKIADYFHDVGIHHVNRLRNRGAGRGDSDGIVFEHFGDNGVNGAGVNERLVSLDVYVDFGFQVSGDFGHSIRTSTVVAPGEDCLATKLLNRLLDAFIVCGNHYTRHMRSLPGSLNHMLDH